MDLKTSTFLVTGGASGLGAASARTLHAGGANVIIADLHADRGETLAKELGAKARFVKYRRDDEADGKAAVDAGGQDVRWPARARSTAPASASARRRRQGRSARARDVRQGGRRQPDRHVQHDPPRRGRDGEGPAERRRRARRDRQHRLGRGIRRPDRPGRLFGLEGRRRRHDAADRARPRAHGIRV